MNNAKDRASNIYTESNNGSEDFILTQATNDLYDRIKTVIFGTFILTTALFFTNTSPYGEAYAKLWYVIALFTMGYGAGLYVFYRFNKNNYPLRFWRLNYLLGVTTLGCVWGLAGILFFNPDSLLDQLLLFTLIVGVTLSAVSNNAVWWRSYVLFLFLTNTPMAIRCILEGDSQYLGLGASFFAYMGVALMMSKSANTTFRNMMILTERNIQLAKELKQQVEVTDAASRAKTKFLASASHDLRQPVHSLSLLAESLSYEVTNNKGKELLGHMSAAVTAIDDLLGKLLDISRLDAGNITAQKNAFPLAVLVSNIVKEAQPVAWAKGLTIEVDDVDYCAFSDHVLLGNILRNLINNALKYTQQGTVRISCESPTSDTLCLSIEDTGIGISSDELGIIFQEFVQLNNPERDRQKGLGLGLSVCKRLAALLEHELTVTSVVGKGTKFSITVPRLSLQDATSHQLKPADTYPSDFDALNGAKILVIDDDPQVLRNTKDLLTTWGGKVAEFSMSTEAIRWCKANPKWADLIISDFRLPGDMTGADTCFEIRKKTLRDIPVIIITGDTTPQRISDLANSGFTVLHKPLRPAFLRNALTSLLKDSKAVNREQVPNKDKKREFN